MMIYEKKGIRSSQNNIQKILSYHLKQMYIKPNLT